MPPGYDPERLVRMVRCFESHDCLDVWLAEVQVQQERDEGIPRVDAEKVWWAVTELPIRGKDLEAFMPLD